MSIRGRAGMGAFGFVLATVVALNVWPLAAQEPTEGKPADRPPPPDAKRAFDPSRRVPSHFGQIGLSPEQKEAVYKVRGKHLPRIESLQKQLAQAQANMMAECESVLSDDQKHQLAVRREAASKARAARAAARDSARTSATKTVAKSETKSSN